jgi:glycosyltransferase involved in cell wall biosynthesis
VRIKLRPDLYFITFRGYEILPFVRLITLGKPLIFDEFINLVEWVVYEHHKFDAKSLPAKILRSFYRFWLKTTNLIVTDTKSHVKYSAKLMNLPIKKYCPLIVSTDEQTFKEQSRKNKAKKVIFNVFYYGSMLPLHGVNYVIEAMKLLKDQPIELTLIGGKGKIEDEVNQAKLDGIRIDYKTWVPFEELPGYIESANVCLGGPFGGTIQSQFVITGKTFQFMQMSRPTIVGHNQESGLFKDKVNALIVEQANAESLAGAILWGSQHREELSKIGLAGGELYRNKYSNLYLTKQLEALLSNNNIF